MHHHTQLNDTLLRDEWVIEEPRGKARKFLESN
jgi:hypothetical protein